jgi:sensor histidine kinase regulating citrate/malate metabolism
VLPDAPLIVIALWILLLAVAVFVVLPWVVYLLHRTLNAARQIEGYAARALEAGVGIADNTEKIEALDATIEVAGQIGPAAQAIEEHTGAIESVLAERAGR